MAFGDVNIQLVDPGLEILPEDITGISVKMGVSTAGPIGEFVAIGSESAPATNYGRGPLVNSLTHHFVASEGKTTLGWRIEADIPGAIGFVIQPITGSPPAVTASGTSEDATQGIIEVLVGGALGTSSFRWSLDGGDSFSGAIATPIGGTFPIPDTLQEVNFTPGVYVAGHRYTWTTTAPSFSLAAFNASMTAMLAVEDTEWEYVHLVGSAADAADSLALATAMGTHMDAAFAAKRYVFALVEMADDTATNLITEFADFANRRVSKAATSVELFSTVTSRIETRSFAWPTAARISQIPISEAASFVGRGNLPSITRINGSLEDRLALDAAHFIVPRTIIGRSGFYVGNPWLSAPEGSDFQYIEYMRVMNVACRTVRDVMLNYLNKGIKVSADTGFILESEATAIEARLSEALRTTLQRPGHISEDGTTRPAITATVPRNENLISLQTLTVNVRIVPLSYARDIIVPIGFENPALTQV